MSLVFRCAFLALLSSWFVSKATAQHLGDWFVNGQTGQNVPGNGRTELAPWKTITYALTQIPRLNPNTQSSNWYTLKVEGNQVYSQATNGEIVPITPAYNVRIEGGIRNHGVMPTIRGVGAGLALDRDLPYEAPAMTIRFLRFEGCGIALSSFNSAVPHAPLISDCSFVSFTSHGIYVSTPTLSQSLVIRRCRFYDSSWPGVVIYPSRAGATRVEIVECSFESMTYEAVKCELDGADSLLLQSTSFRDCNRGLLYRYGPNSLRSQLVVRSSSFEDLTNEAIYVITPSGSLSTNTNIDGCVFLRCGHGLRFEILALEGASHILTMRRNTARHCAVTGFSVRVSGPGNFSHHSTRNLAEHCATGFAASFLAVQFQSRFEADRALHNAIGMNLASSALGTFQVESSMICANSQFGLSSSARGPINIRNTTFADNGSALLTLAAATVADSIFAANRISSASSQPQVSFSCFDHQGPTGTGNLHNTDPLLLRPFYKLAPNSPCIDTSSGTQPLTATDYEGDPRSSISQPNGAPISDMGADEYVLIGSIHNYGARGLGNFGFSPTILSPNSGVSPGQPLTIDLANAIMPDTRVPATGAVLAIGLQDNSGRFPFELTSFGAPGSWLWTDMALLFGPYPVTPGGTARVTFPLPNEPLLTGKTVTFQWLAILAGTNAAGIVTTDGLRVTIGR